MNDLGHIGKVPRKSDSVIWGSPQNCAPHMANLSLCNREAKLLLGSIPQAQGLLVNSDQGIRQTEC